MHERTLHHQAVQTALLATSSPGEVRPLDDDDIRDEARQSALQLLREVMDSLDRANP